MRYLKQSTAVTVKIGPFVDDTDGKTPETGLTISQGDVKLSKNGGAYAQKNDATACTHDADGEYGCPLDTTDTGTLGTLTLMVAESGALPVKEYFQVLTAEAYETLMGTDKFTVELAANQDVRNVGGNVAGSVASVTNAVTLTAAYDAAKNALPTSSYTAPDNAGIAAIKAKTDNLPASPAAVGSAMTLTEAYDAAKTAATQASVTTIDGIVDSILEDTGTAGVVVADKTGFSLSAAGVKAIWDQLLSATFTTASLGAKLKAWVLGTDNKVILSADEHTGATITTEVELTEENISDIADGITEALGGSEDVPIFVETAAGAQLTNTLTGLVGMLRHRLNDLDGGNYTSEEIYYAINLAYRETVTTTRSSKARVNVSLVAGTHTYDCGTVFEPISVTIGSDILQKTSVKQMGIKTENWDALSESTPARATPTEWMPYTGGSIRLYPTPDAVGTVTVYGYAYPTVLTNGTDVPVALPTAYAVSAILDRAEAEARKMRATTAANAALYSSLMDSWKNWCSKIAVSVKGED